MTVQKARKVRLPRRMTRKWSQRSPPRSRKTKRKRMCSSSKSSLRPVPGGEVSSGRDLGSRGVVAGLAEASEKMPLGQFAAASEEGGSVAALVPSLLAPGGRTAAAEADVGAKMQLLPVAFGACPGVEVHEAQGARLTTVATAAAAPAKTGRTCLLAASLAVAAAPAAAVHREEQMGMRGVAPNL